MASTGSITDLRDGTRLTTTTARLSIDIDGVALLALRFIVKVVEVTTEALIPDSGSS